MAAVGKEGLGRKRGNVLCATAVNSRWSGSPFNRRRRTKTRVAVPDGRRRHSCGISSSCPAHSKRDLHETRRLVDRPVLRSPTLYPAHSGQSACHHPVQYTSIFFGRMYKSTGSCQMNVCSSRVALIGMTASIIEAQTYALHVVVSRYPKTPHNNKSPTHTGEHRAAGKREKVNIL